MSGGRGARDHKRWERGGEAWQAGTVGLRSKQEGRVVGSPSDLLFERLGSVLAP